MLLELINVLCYGKVLACLLVGEHLQLQAGANEGLRKAFQFTVH